MIDVDAFLGRLTASGVGLASGVPCSYLSPLLDRVATSGALRYVPAANEGDALAIAAGAWLGGTHGLVLMQSSGLGNTVNPLTSLNEPFHVPAVLLVTWRAEPGGPPDEPQHHQMGQILPELLRVLGVPTWILPTGDGWEGVVDEALATRDRTERPVALIVRHGTFPATAAPPARAPHAAGPAITGDLLLPTLTRRAALEAVRGAAPDGAALIATTGYTGRELYALGDRPDQLYVVGAMGCASSLALGLALTRPGRPIVCLDGDGATLMRMGALSTIGAEHPANLLHIVLDNGCHDSTGGQPTVTHTTDLAAVAAACGYRRVVRAGTAAALAAVVAAPWDGPTFVHVPTLPGATGKLPRPTVTPPEVARRLRAWVA